MPTTLSVTFNQAYIFIQAQCAYITM